MKKNQNMEVVKPIKKEVKRPFMKSLSLILIPLSVGLILTASVMYAVFWTYVRDAKDVTDEEWKTYAKMSRSERYLYGDYAGCKSYEDYKEIQWERLGYDSALIIEILVLGVASGVAGFVCKRAYKSGQEEVNDG